MGIIFTSELQFTATAVNLIRISFRPRTNVIKIQENIIEEYSDLYYKFRSRDEIKCKKIMHNILLYDRRKIYPLQNRNVCITMSYRILYVI